MEEAKSGESIPATLQKIPLILALHKSHSRIRQWSRLVVGLPFPFISSINCVDIYRWEAFVLYPADMIVNVGRFSGSQLRRQDL
jgi:hypothetical protein